VKPANKKICDGCGKSQIIWKNVLGPGGRERYCAHCWSCRKSSDTKPTAHKSPRPRSSKRAKQESEYSQTRKVFLEEHPFCQITIPGCTHKATEVHHLDGRIEEKLIDQDGWKATCRYCHRWVHANPRDARELGHLI